MTARSKVFALTALALSSSIAAPSLNSANAGTLFSRAEVDQSKLVAIASPYANGSAHQLLIVQQLSGARPCWSESNNGNGPTMINPLLGQFDFTGICGRSTDSNGYSVRVGDQDMGWKYSLRVVKRNNDLTLVGVPVDRTLPELQIGRANGVTNGFAKLYLNPGWRMTNRVYNGQTMGHIYLTNDQPLTSVVASAPIPPAVSLPKPTTPSKPVVSPTTGTSSGSIGAVKPAPKPATAVKPVSTVQPGPKPSTSVPIVVPRPATTGSSSVTPPATLGAPAVGKPIAVPLPAIVTQPGSGSSTNGVKSPIVQSPTVKPPIVQSPAVKPPVVKPSVAQSPVVKPATTAPKPILNSGDYVVPTVEFYP